MKAKEIRQSFLGFFQKYDHIIVPSAPVAPLDDPTLLFTNAGMNQFKDVFLDTGTRSYTRAVDTQKCIRVSGKHNDLEEVGHDTYHHTFFEMLGNWSFGDYYKEEAILWAWELLTKVWELPKNKLYATVFREDEEAEGLWKNVTDINHSRILKFDEKDNFWEMGSTGPCGPCSEIHIDLGEGYCDKKHISGHKCGVNTGCSRFIELWNLVFIQYNRRDSGSLHVLPKKHIDTGMGFERVSAVLQGKKSNYETDIFTPILDQISELTNLPWKNSDQIAAFRVIADHIRTLTFAITDGVLPSNEGRGYVLRRLLRRAARYSRKLNMQEPYIYKLVDTVVNVQGDAFPEIRERYQHSTHVIQSEEERFNEVLDRGMEIFESIAKDVEKKGQNILPGVEAFKLYDTYGFPLDLTQLLASERGLVVDQTEFEAEMSAQRHRARESHQFAYGNDENWITLSDGEHSKFVGYEFISTDSNIRKYQVLDNIITLILDQTPFYAESGGQKGDAGKISGEGFEIDITHTVKQGDRILHIGQMKSGKIGQPSVYTEVYADQRTATECNHTATHLLHKALKSVLGDHVNQAGSLVAPDRLRFDFTHFEGVTQDQMNAVEWQVNRQIRHNYPVSKYNASLKEARANGATALFGEKYGDEVRVVQIADYSMELCGGTHVNATGEIGYFRILSEESVSAGVRRIEAVTGESADRLIRHEKETLKSAAAMLKCRPDEMEARIQVLLEDRKNLEKKLKQAQQNTSGSELAAVLENRKEVDGVSIVLGKVEVTDMDGLRHLGDELRERLKSGVGFIGAVIDDKVNLLCVVTDDLIRKKGLKAGSLVKAMAVLVDGGGGGKPHMAMAGGKNIARLQEALEKAGEIVSNAINNKD